MTEPYSNANLPRKRIGATVLYLNDEGEVLIVKPTYRKGWLTPGGTVQENETPYAGCRREVREELGVDFTVEGLACIGYRSAHDDKVENIQFVFWGGVLSPEQVSSIRLQESELEQFRFCAPDRLGDYLNKNLASRCRLALEGHAKGSIAYEENMQVR